MKYFSYSPDSGIDFHEYIESAHLASVENLDRYEEKAAEDGEWDHDVELVCYGEVLNCATESIAEGSSVYSMLSVDLSKDFKK